MQGKLFNIRNLHQNFQLTVSNKSRENPLFHIKLLKDRLTDEWADKVTYSVASLLKNRDNKHKDNMNPLLKYWECPMTNLAKYC